MKIHCKVLVALALAVAPVAAQPKLSQHPRIGKLADVQFHRDMATLPVGSERELGEIAAWAKQNPDGLIVIEGHADREGKRAYNLALSTRRADSVVEQLLVLGIPREQLIVASFGESRNGRRVVVWSTRAGEDAIRTKLQARGARSVRTSNLMARS